MKASSPTLLSLLAFLSALAVFANEADAQQRRRAPRRPRGAATEPASDVVADAPGPETTEANATDAPAPTAETPPESAVTTPEAPAVETTRPATPAVDPTLESGPDLAPLRQEYAAIMDELVNARARVAIVGKALFKTKVRIILQNRAGDAQSLERVVLRLDGAPIYRKDDGAGLDDGAQVFEGFATPGPHALDLEAQQRSREGDGFGYTLRETFRVSVKKDRLTEITIVLDDDSDMAEDFPEDGEGEYDLRTRVSAATYDLEAR